MAKTWEQIMRECTYVSLKQSKADEEEMLRELGITKEEFMMTEEYWRVHKMAADGLLWPQRKKKRKDQ